MFLIIVKCNTDNWSLGVCGGYYGDEIDAATIDKTAIPAEKLKELLAYKDSAADMIKTALINEYGYVLPELEKAVFSVEKVALKNIVIGQANHYKKLDSNIIKRYSGFDLPLGICVPIDDEKFRLIDGYHRIAAAKKNNKKTVEMIIGRKNEF